MTMRLRCAQQAVIAAVQPPNLQTAAAAVAAVLTLQEPHAKLKMVSYLSEFLSFWHSVVNIANV